MSAFSKVEIQCSDCKPFDFCSVELHAIDAQFTDIFVAQVTGGNACMRANRQPIGKI